MNAKRKAPDGGGKGKIGSRFDDFLREHGTYAQTQAVAIKRVLAWQLAQEMKKQTGGETGRGGKSISCRRFKMQIKGEVIRGRSLYNKQAPSP